MIDFFGIYNIVDDDEKKIKRIYKNKYIMYFVL